jgi:hypothetical protein
MSLRYDVGWDFRWYYNLALDNSLDNLSIFTSAKNFSQYYAFYFDKFNLHNYLRLEILNKLIYKLVWLFNSPQILIFCYCLLLLIPIKKGLDSYKKHTIYPWILLFSYKLFLPFFLSIMRQGVAVSIIFYSYKYIRENRFWKFLICVLFASGFHKTAIFMIPFYFICNYKYNIKLYFLIFLFSFFSLKFFKILLLLPIPILSHYRTYIIHSIGIGGNKLYYLIILIGISLIFLIYAKRQYYIKNKFFINMVFIGCIMYISLTNLGHLSIRMSVYFFIYSLYFIDEIILINRYKIINKYIFFILCFLIMISFLLIDKANKNIEGLRSEFIPYKIFIFHNKEKFKKL